MNEIYPGIRKAKQGGEYLKNKNNERTKKIGTAVIAASLVLGGAVYGISNMENIKAAYAEYNHKTAVAEVPFVINEQGEGVQAGLMDALKDYDEDNNTDYFDQIPYEQMVYEAQEASKSNYDATGNRSVDFGDGFKAEILKTDRNGDITLSVTSNAAERKADSEQ
jgi:hypothetical protein